MSSFRRFGGLNYSSNNAFTKSYISNVEKMNINNYSGQPNAKEIFACHIDLSGNSILHTGTIYFQDGTSMSSSSSSGNSGAQGPPGATGPQGVTGSPGENGYTGSPGPQGVTGSPGENGYTGAPGPQGATGSPGENGYTGPPGPQGATGSPGENGYTGAPGPQGATGPQGPSGSGDNYWTLNNNTLSNNNNIYGVQILGNPGNTGGPVLYIDGGNISPTDASNVLNSSYPVLSITLGTTGPSNFLLFQDSASGSTTFANTGSNKTMLCACDFNVNGNFTATGNITAGSDYRIKTNITPLNLYDHSIDNLNPVHFKFKQTNKESIGVIAHELQEHLPFLVEGSKDGDQIQTVNYIGLIGVLIKEVQELKKRVHALETK